MRRIIGELNEVAFYSESLGLWKFGMILHSV